MEMSTHVFLGSGKRETLVVTVNLKQNLKIASNVFPNFLFWFLSPPGCVYILIFFFLLLAAAIATLLRHI